MRSAADRMFRCVCVRAVCPASNAARHHNRPSARHMFKPSPSLPLVRQSRPAAGQHPAAPCFRLYRSQNADGAVPQAAPGGAARPFHLAVIKQVVPENPAMFVKEPKFSRQVGITPIMEAEQVHLLLDSIPVTPKVKVAARHGWGIGMNRTSGASATVPPSPSWPIPSREYARLWDSGEAITVGCSVGSSSGGLGLDHQTASCQFFCRAA